MSQRLIHFLSLHTISIKYEDPEWYDFGGHGWFIDGTQVLSRIRYTNGLDLLQVLMYIIDIGFTDWESRNSSEVIIILPESLSRPVNIPYGELLYGLYVARIYAYRDPAIEEANRV